MDANASPSIDWAEDTVWQGPFGKAPNYTSLIKTRSFSRTLLDAYMVSKLTDQENIQVLTASARQLEISDGAIAGVCLRDGRILKGG